VCEGTLREDAGMSSKTGKDFQVDPRVSFRQFRILPRLER